MKMRMPFRIMGVLLLLLFMFAGFTALYSCSNPKTSYSAPNLTAQEAKGIVRSAIAASTPAIQTSAVYYDAKFNNSSNQWLIMVWPREYEGMYKLYQRGNVYAEGGSVYIVDDATGKLLNPPPVYTPK